MGDLGPSACKAHAFFTVHASSPNTHPEGSTKVHQNLWLGLVVGWGLLPLLVHSLLSWCDSLQTAVSAPLLLLCTHLCSKRIDRRIWSWIAEPFNTLPHWKLAMRSGIPGDSLPPLSPLVSGPAGLPMRWRAGDHDRHPRCSWRPTAVPMRSSPGP